MKLISIAALFVLTFGAQFAHAQTPAPTPPAVAVFLASDTHCSVLVGGTDRAGDGADGTYADSLNKALTAIGGSLPSAAELIRSACLASPAISLAPERPKSPSSP